MNLFPFSLGQLLDTFFQSVTNDANFLFQLFRTSRFCHRIIKVPEHPLFCLNLLHSLPGRFRQDHYKIKKNIIHFSKCLRILAGKINADFLHDLDGHFVELAGIKTRAVGGTTLREDGPCQPLGHLAPTGIVFADEENFHAPILLQHCGFSRHFEVFYRGSAATASLYSLTMSSIILAKGLISSTRPTVCPADQASTHLSDFSPSVRKRSMLFFRKLAG